MFPNLSIFVFSRNLQLDMFEGADFKYHNSFFKFQLKDTQIRYFWSELSGFLFCTKLCNQENLRALISNMAMTLSNSSPKIHKWSIFCPKCKYFLFCMKLRILKNSRLLIRKMAIAFFSNSSQKYTNTKFSWKTQKFFIFKWNFEWT